MVLVYFLSWPAFAATNLEQCFDAALKQSETVGIQQELIVQAEQRYRQAKGAVLPTINFIGTYLRQDDTRQTGVSGAFAQPDQTTARLNGQQALFRGFREFAALRVAKSNEKASQADLARARMQLFSDVANSFYTVLALEKDAVNLKELRRLTEERRKELNERRRIGRSRLSEVLTIETQIKTLVSQISLAEGQLQMNREALKFLTGLDKNVVLEDQRPLPQKVPALQEFIAQVSSRPDVQGAQERIAGAESSIATIKGGHFPTLDLNGNYYFKRPGILTQTKWDLQLNLVFPLYAGGVITSQTAEASSRLRQSELELSRVRRSADLEVNQSYQNLIAISEQVAALRDAVQVSERNYKTQTQEYRLGLVTNLDVLQAMNVFLETKRNFDRAVFQEKQEFVRLENLSGHRLN